MIKETGKREREVYLSRDLINYASSSHTSIVETHVLHFVRPYHVHVRPLIMGH